MSRPSIYHVPFVILKCNNSRMKQFLNSLDFGARYHLSGLALIETKESELNHFHYTELGRNIMVPKEKLLENLCETWSKHQAFVYLCPVIIILSNCLKSANDQFYITFVNLFDLNDVRVYVHLFVLMIHCTCCK